MQNTWQEEDDEQKAPDTYSVVIAGVFWTFDKCRNV